LAASEIDDALRGAGVPDESEVCEISLALGGGDVSFLFMATQLPSAEAAEAPAPVSVASPPGNLPHLLKVRMPLTIRLGSTRMSLDDVLRLTQGSLVELDQREDEPLDVLANGRVVARGEVVVVDERFGLRITEIGTTEDRARTAG
jgi:flagellar motor switch protein FliN/FliY